MDSDHIGNDDQESLLRGRVTVRATPASRKRAERAKPARSNFDRKKLIEDATPAWSGSD